MSLISDIDFKDIEYDKDMGKHRLKDKTGLLTATMYKDENDFDLDYLVRYIKKVENLVRTDERYKAFKSNLITKGYDRCVILGNIVNSRDNEMADIEMHHGPIFTLFDICFIILNHNLKMDKKISTFNVALEVIQAHFDDLVQTVMLAKTVHEQEHDNNIFINLDQCASGDIIKFVEKYKLGITTSHINQLMEYIKLSQSHDVYVGDILEVTEEIEPWNN